MLRASRERGLAIPRSRAKAPHVVWPRYRLSVHDTRLSVHSMIHLFKKVLDMFTHSAILFMNGATSLREPDEAPTRNTEDHRRRGKRRPR